MCSLHILQVVTVLFVNAHYAVYTPLKLKFHASFNSERSRAVSSPSCSEAPGSNLDQESSYSDRAFSWLFSLQTKGNNNNYCYYYYYAHVNGFPSFVAVNSHIKYG